MYVYVNSTRIAGSEAAQYLYAAYILNLLSCVHEILAGLVGKSEQIFFLPHLFAHIFWILYISQISLEKLLLDTLIAARWKQ